MQFVLKIFKLNAFDPLFSTANSKLLIKRDRLITIAHSASCMYKYFLLYIYFLIKVYTNSNRILSFRTLIRIFSMKMKQAITYDEIAKN